MELSLPNLLLPEHVYVPTEALVTAAMVSPLVLSTPSVTSVVVPVLSVNVHFRSVGASDHSQGRVNDAPFRGE